MESVNVTEFYQAGLTFNMQSEDLKLANPTNNIDKNGDPEDWANNPNNPETWTTWQQIAATSGELAGYSEVGPGYFGDDRVETEHTPLCDTTSLSDDFLAVAETSIVELDEEDDDFEEDIDTKQWKRKHDLVNGRWAHVKDADIAERAAKNNLFQRLDTVNRPYGEMETMSNWRKERYARMMAYIESCNDEAKLRSLQKGAWERYLKSVKSCAASKSWWALYLTKHEVREVSSLITDKRKELLGR